ncbi:MAG: hypothetical protein JWM21_2703 [Acidobacteria bacterium]|nr:hypothetical protein [Acidobacteriota bacterium]
MKSAAASREKESPQLGWSSVSPQRSARSRHRFRYDVLLGRSVESSHRVGFCSEQSASTGNALITHSSEGNLVTIGKTGSGKGRSALIPNLVTYRGSTIVLDLKGELYRTTFRARREMGQRVFLLDPFNQISADPDRLNFFDLLTLTGNEEIDTEAQSLAHIFGRENSVKDPFWDIEGTGLLAGCISAVATMNPPELQNFRALIGMFMADDIVYSLATIMDKRSREMTPMARHEIGSFLSLADVTRSGVLATATSYLKTYTSEQIIRSLCDSTISLPELIAGKTPFTIYVVIPPAYIRSHFNIVKAWVHTLMKALMTRKEIPETPTLFFLDEIAQGTLPILENIMTIGRGYGIKCWLFLQNINQLKARYQTGWATMLGNCDVWQIFAANDHLTAKELSEVTGIAPASFLTMQRNEQYLVINGLIQKGRKLDYLTDPMFAGLFDDNPYYKMLRRRRNRGNT